MRYGRCVPDLIIAPVSFPDGFKLSNEYSDDLVEYIIQPNEEPAELEFELAGLQFLSHCLGEQTTTASLLFFEESGINQLTMMSCEDEDNLDNSC